MPDDWVLLAELRRARGLRGEIFADPMGTRLERFAPGLRVLLSSPDGTETREAELERSWDFQRRLVLKFMGIDSRTEAEIVEQWKVKIPLKDRPELPEGEHYLADLEGFQVETMDGRVLGKVTGFTDIGPQLLLECGTMLIPFVEPICKVVDRIGKRVVVDLPEGLEELNTG